MNKTALRIISESVDSAIEGGLEQLALKRDNVEIVINRRGISLFGLVIMPAVVSIVYDMKDVGSALELEHELVQLDISPDGVFLFHSGPLDPATTIATIIKHLEQKNIYGTEETRIEEFVKSDDDEKILIHELEVVEAGGANIAFIVSEDSMRVFAVKFEAAEIAEKDLRSALVSAGIFKGLNEQALQEICSEGDENEFYLMAEGVEAVDEVVQQPFFNVIFNQLKPKHCQDPDSPDLPVIRIASVKQNQLIAKRGNRTPGHAGYSIDGSVIDYQKTEWERIHGGNHTFSVSGEPEIYASMSGEAIYHDDGRLDVSPALIIDGDVEGEPVEFEGKIIVTGNAPAQSSLTATDDVIVLGSADGAIISSGGEVIIYNGRKLQLAVEEEPDQPVEPEKTEQEKVDEEVQELKEQIEEISDDDYDIVMEEMERQTSNIVNNSSMLDRLRKNKEAFEELRSDHEELEGVTKNIGILVPEIERLNKLKDSGEELNMAQEVLLDEHTTRMAQLMMLKEEKKHKLLNISTDERLSAEEDKEYEVAEEEVAAFLEAIEKYATEDSPDSMSAFEKIDQTVNTNSGLTIEETRKVQQELVEVRGKIEHLGPRVEKLRARKESGERLTDEERAVLDEEMAVLMELMIQEEDDKMKLLGKG